MAQTKRKLKVICTLNKRLMEPDFQMCWRTRGRRPRDVEKALSCVERRGEENFQSGNTGPGAGDGGGTSMRHEGVTSTSGGSRLVRSSATRCGILS